MTLIELCENLKKAMGLPYDLHVAAVFQDNDHDEIIGWRVLDRENNSVTDTIPSEDIKNWKKYKTLQTV